MLLKANCYYTKRKFFQINYYKDSLDADEEKADKIFMEVQDNLSAMELKNIMPYMRIRIANAKTLTNKDIQNLLIESGVP